MPQRRDREQVLVKPRIKSTSTPSLDALSDTELLEMRRCGLGVRIVGTLLAERIEQLYKELLNKLLNLRLRYRTP